MSLKGEKRKAPRIARRAAVRFYSGDVSAEGVILNFSEIGLFIQTDFLLPADSMVSIPALGSSKESIVLQGKVRWVRKPSSGHFFDGGMGIELFAVPQEYLRFVTSLRSQELQKRRGVEERFEVYLKFSRKTPEGIIIEHTENLSKSGMFLASEFKWSPGDILEGEIQISELDPPIPIQGQVMYCLKEADAKKSGRTQGVGVKFVHLSEKSTQQIYQYIKRLEVHRTQPERRMVDRIPVSGSLEDFLVPEILLGISNQCETGKLTLQRGNISKSIYFKQGKPVYVESNLRTETLGQFLVRKGMISSQDLEDSLEELAKSDVHHGEIMLAGGMIDGTTLASALVGHQEEKIINTFTWFDGRFEFAKGTQWPPNVSILPLQLFKMVLEGIDRWYDGALVRAWMGLNEETPLRRFQMPASDIPLPPKIFRILTFSSRCKTIREIAEYLHLSVNEVLPSLYTLIISGLMVVDFGKSEEEVEKKAEVNEPEKVKPTEEGMEVLRRWLAEDFRRLSGLNFFELFDLDPSSSEEEITKAYLERLSRYESHDVGRITDPQIKENVGQIRSWIQLAYDTLLDPHLRQIYSRKAVAGSVQRKRERVEAERFLLQCIRDLEQGNIDKALENLTLGQTKYPENKAIPGYLGWALFQKEHGTNIQKAIELLDAAIELDPSDSQLRYYRGEISLYLREWKKAEGYFSDAVRLHPNFMRAKAALALVQEKKKEE